MLMKSMAIRWAPHPDKGRTIQLASIEADWIDTPYRLNTCVKRRGVDCLNLVAAVLEELRGRESEIRSKHRGDVSMHKPETAVQVVEDFAEEFEATRLVGYAYAVPGDVLMWYRDTNHAPQHACLVSSQRGKLFHASHSKASYCGFIFPSDCYVVHFRPSHR